MTELRFLIETPQDLTSVEIPAGISHLPLPLSRKSPPRLVGQPPRGRGRGGGRAKHLTFEAIVSEGRELLFVDCRDLPGIRLNGEPCPSLAALMLRDELRVAPGTTLHLTAYREPRLGPPPPDRVGEECPVCRTPLLESQRAYACPCGQPLHCEGEEVAGEDRLECAMARSVCPACGGAVRLTAGYQYWPGACPGDPGEPGKSPGKCTGE